MNYKPYPKNADMPSRKSRKGARCIVFVFNYKASKLRKKSERLARRIAE